MKKTLSLILAVMMLLSCLTLPAFAGAQEPGVAIAGTMLTADGIVSNTAITAITSGTVTYTAASGGNPAKLILNNAVISGPCEAPIISVNDLNLVIELIGNNQVTAGSNAAVKSMGAVLTITGSGSLIIHGNGGEDSVAIVVKGFGGITLSEGCKMVGSTSTTEENISSMTEATFSTENKTYMVGEAVAQTVAIYNSNAASGKSGNTDITATVANSLSYEMVIPSAVSMTEAGVKEIGTPSVENVKHATANTVISYTASGTNFKLSTDESKTMTATYYSAYTDASTNTVLDSTKAIEVYKNSELVDPLTKLYVGVTQTDWDAAENGTYTATVTYNFTSKEVTPVTAADALVPDAMYELKFQFCPEGQEPERDCFTYKRTTDGFEVEKTLFNDNDWTVTYGAYCTSTAEGSNIIINFASSATFTLNTSTNTYCITGEKAPYTEFISFSVKPAGATEFTEITLTKAELF